MEKEVFSYSYSAKESAELQDIRKRYTPRESNKLEQLRKLDQKVQEAGMPESLCAGIIGALIFGVGMCLCLEVFGAGILNMVLGVVIGLVGAAGMIWAYPLYCRRRNQVKEKHTPEILQLLSELTGETIE